LQLAGGGIMLVVLLSPGIAGAKPATVDEARAFLDRAESTLLDLWISAERAAWVKSNFITDDTEAIAADALEALIAATADLSAESTKFDTVKLPAELRRKIRMIKTSLPLVAPRDASAQAELSAISTSLESVYGKGSYCSDARGGECLDLTEMTRVLASSRDAAELLDLWKGWRGISPPMRDDYARFVELVNAGARELGFADMGQLWRSGYDMSPAAFAAVRKASTPIEWIGL
jgi:peptidyl-dipeptidase A